MSNVTSLFSNNPISKKNVVECEQALRELREHLENLASMTKRYPVECSFGGYRFVFRRREDIEATISALDDELSRYRSIAA